LVVVIGIVAVLAGAAAVVAVHLRKSAETTGQKANFQAIDAALKAYYQDFGDYPRNPALPKWNTGQAGPGEAPTPAPLFYSLASGLLGPGPAVTQAVHGEVQTGDGNDGAGFRSESRAVFSGMAVAEAGNAVVEVKADAAELTKAEEFAREFVPSGNGVGTRASACLLTAAGEPFQESIGIGSVSVSGDRIWLTLMVPPSYGHEGRCEVSVAEGKVWGPYLSPGEFRVAFIPSVNSFGYPFFGFGQPVLLDDWGQVIQYFPRYGRAAADSAVAIGPLYGYSQPKSVDPAHGENALWDWRDGAPFFTLVGQTGPAEQWPAAGSDSAGLFRPELAIEWMLGCEPNVGGDFTNVIVAPAKLNCGVPYILISTGADGPERPNGGYCNFADLGIGNNHLTDNDLQQAFAKSGNIYNFDRR
jgi:type II secretory pathway pseudopilin PulG